MGDLPLVVSAQGFEQNVCGGDDDDDDWESSIARVEDEQQQKKGRDSRTKHPNSTMGRKEKGKSFAETDAPLEEQ